MSKNIVLLSDGTGNSSAKVLKTNVWRLFQALDLRDPERQIAYYDDGIGTSSFRPLAILEGVFGIGLKHNVLDIYSFCCRNYQPGDRIYGFGFSRGAFTIRVVAGFIARIGLIRYDGNDEHLARDAAIAYREYRRVRNFRSGGNLLIGPLRKLRDFVSHVLLRNPSLEELDRVEVDRIEFLGVWDTVDAYGGPIEEITRAIDYWYWPLSMPDQFMNRKILRACHALALEEERDAFRPVLWDDRYVRGDDGLHPVTQDWTPRRTPVPGDPHIDDERISQVWFVGVHSDIGGGYSRAGLAHWTLAWMIERAKVYGLTLLQWQENELEPFVDRYDRLNDSRHGLGGYYRYRPRRLIDIYSLPPYKLSIKEDLRHISSIWNGQGDPEHEVKHDLASPDFYVPRPAPKIHQSVFDRITKGTDAYAPIVLPQIYDAVADSGAITANAGGANARSRSLREEKVWDWVWARRVTYFLTVAASLFLAALPVIDKWKPGRGPASPAEVVVPLIDLLGAFLPNFVKPWLDAFRNTPGRFLGGVIAVGVLMYASGWMQGHIRDLMRQIWRVPGAPAVQPSGFVYRLRTAGTYQAFFYLLKHWILPAFFALLIFVCLAYAALVVINRISFAAMDLTGQVCSPSKATQPVGASGTATVDAAKLCNATGLAVAQGKSYRLTLVVTEPFEDHRQLDESDPERAKEIDKEIDKGTDKGIETDPQGFGFDKMLWQQALALPVRRLVGSNWFATVLRVGNRGFGEIVPTFQRKWSSQGGASFVTTFRARKTGELFVYVNDAVLGIPGVADTFYRNNKGKAELTIEPVE